MATNFEKFLKLLQELFQLDQADLDFGIYRIMNQKRDEVTRFLKDELPPKVKAAFEKYKPTDRAAIQKDIEDAIDQARALGAGDPEQLPKVRELRARLGTAVDVTGLENEVYSHLTNFFRRYYDAGDFISMRRYKRESATTAKPYAIPYAGEEVKLHWANADQYYIKSTETFRDYTFTVQSGKRVRVHLVAATTEQDDKKPTAGKERRFVLGADEPVREENGELYIRFEYKEMEGKEKQEALNTQAIDAILKAKGVGEWAQELGKLAPTDGNTKRTVLEKHLTQYTARNTFDYFIHKDLGGFLRRELDFFIKNEVMHLDDIEDSAAPKVEQYLSKIKVIRSIAHKIIAFLEQLENFQKKLWLKKKFVIETNYCVTLDRVQDDELYKEIAKSDAQREEWVKLFAIDQIASDVTGPGYSKPLTVEFLKANPSLTLNTRHFSAEFRSRLLRKIDNLDAACEVILLNSDNFQALSLMQSRFIGKVNCVYIDPPYNTDASPIIYKNGYRRSSWTTLMANRIVLEEVLRAPASLRCIAIDDFEYPDLQGVVEAVSKDIHHATAVVRSKPQGRPTASGFSANHEYAIFYGSPDSVIGRLPRTGSKAERYPYSDEKGIYSWANFRKSGTDSNRNDRRKSYYPVFVKGDVVRIPDMQWDETKKDWELLEKPREGEVAVLPIDQDTNEKVWTCSPERAREEIADIRVESGSERVEIYKKYRPNQDGALPGTWWEDAGYSASESGTKVLKDMFGSKDFDYPKSINLVVDCLRVGNLEPGGLALDYFAGSGTTGHAVIKLNREDGGSRRVVLAEQGRYFDTVLVPRLRKAVYSPEWKDGKPARSATPDEIERGPKLMKVIRLESYEDALNNLVLKRDEKQQSLLDEDADVREEYLLSYMLELESRDSLLNLDGFRNPDEYKLRVERDGETQSVNVDLVETFNWLLGLTVKHIDRIGAKDTGFVRVVEGTNPAGERVLVLWRNIDETDSDKLDKWFKKQRYSTQDLEFDLVYVNGDNNLENLRRGDQTWKVRLIEEEFQRLMFDVKDADTL